MGRFDPGPAHWLPKKEPDHWMQLLAREGALCDRQQPRGVLLLGEAVQPGPPHFLEVYTSVLREDAAAAIIGLTLGFMSGLYLWSLVG